MATVTDAMPLIETPEQGREFLENSPRVWPYVLAVVMGRAGLGPAASAYGMDPQSFGHVCEAAFTKCDAVVLKIDAQRLAAS